MQRIILVSCLVSLTLGCTITNSTFLATAGDGYCDRNANQVESCFDGGDCCPNTCTSSVYGCGVAGYDCKLYTPLAITSGIVQCDTIIISNMNQAGCDGVYTRVSGNRFTSATREMFYGSSCNQFYCCPKGGSCACASGGFFAFTSTSNARCITAVTGYTRPTPSATSISCLTGAARISTDYSSITNQVSSVSIDGGFLTHANLVGETAFPILVVNQNVVGAAARLGSGRVAAFGHSTFVSSASLSATPGIGPLILNTLRWLAGRDSAASTTRPVIGFVSGSTTFSALQTYLGRFPADFTVTRVTLTSVNAQQAVADVLVIDMGSPFATTNATAVRAWTAAGKGLLAVSTAWAFNHPNGFAELADFPGNVMLAGSGIVFSSSGFTPSSLTWTVPATVPSLPASNILCGLRTIGAYASSSISLSSADLTSISTSVTTGLGRMSPSAANALQFTNLYTVTSSTLSSIKPALPSASNAVPTASNPLLFLENQILLQLDPTAMTAHPSSSLFPGAPSGNAQSFTVVVNGTYGLGWPSFFINSGPLADVWRPLGVYAAPGATITVTVPSSAVASRLAIRIGSHSDILRSKDTLNRYPQISLRFPIRSTVTRAANPWGGLVFITVPRGTSLGSISVTVEGGLASPLYIHGSTTQSDWTSQLALQVPWAVLTTNKLMLMVPIDWARSAGYPSDLMTFWDTILDAAANLAGISTVRPRPEAIAIDVQISNGYMHSAYPIMAPLQAPELTNIRSIRTSTAWGYFHELGHNHQSSAWQFSGTTEVSVNLYTVHAFHTVLNLTTDQARPGWNRAADRLVYLSGWPTPADYTGKWRTDPFLALDSFLLLQESFGWDLYRTLFRNYMNVDQSRYPTVDQAVLDHFVSNISRVAGFNLFPYFKTWNLPVSSSVNTQLDAEGLGIWSLDPMLDFHGAPLVSASDIRLTNDTDGRAGRVSVVVSFVRAANETGNYVTANVASYKVFLGSATNPRAIELASASLNALGGSPGTRVATGISVSFATNSFTQLTVVAASAYRNAWGTNHVSVNYVDAANPTHSFHHLA